MFYKHKKSSLRKTLLLIQFSFGNIWSGNLVIHNTPSFIKTRFMLNNFRIHINFMKIFGTIKMLVLSIDKLIPVSDTTVGENDALQKSFIFRNFNVFSFKKSISVNTWCSCTW